MWLWVIGRGIGNKAGGLGAEEQTLGLAMNTSFANVLICPLTLIMNTNFFPWLTNMDGNVPMYSIVRASSQILLFSWLYKIS